MDSLLFAKTVLFTACGILFSVIAECLGGFDDFIKTLLVFMIIDFITGWLVAAVFKKSRKTESGRLASGAGLRGLLKKGCIFLMVVISVMLDDLMHTNGFTRDAVIIAFILNELVSILENMGLMGIKLPDALTNALEMLGKDQPKKP